MTTMRIPYAMQWFLTLIFTIAIFVVSSVISQGEGLDLSRRALIVLGIVNGVLGLIQAALPKLYHPPSEARVGKD